MKQSRIANFYKLSIAERLQALVRAEAISTDDYELLSNGKYQLKPESADCMIENVIGIFTLPVGLALNFLINDRDYLIPMVVEEPSIIAAVSAAAKLARGSGGFRSCCAESLLIGQVQLVQVNDPIQAKQAIAGAEQGILSAINCSQPRLVERGGGARALEIRSYPDCHGNGEVLVIHLLVDTRDAMGANLVNQICETVAPILETLTKGKAILRILSNLTDRSLVRSEVVLPISELSFNGFNGEQVRDGIISASEFASADAYRAATHNKGIMNGIDAVALATGNDWRAIEAGAHAYAGLGQGYRPLTQWLMTAEGHLRGSLTMPMKVGIVGAQVEAHPAVRVHHRLLGVKTARELAEVMGAVGLAQNFAALRALATEGIGRGHMRLHARSVALAAGAPRNTVDAVVAKLVANGTIKTWKAREIVAEISANILGRGVASGKAILLGEHAVMYGSHALGVAIPNQVECTVTNTEQNSRIRIREWNVEWELFSESSGQDTPHASALLLALSHIWSCFKVSGKQLFFDVQSKIEAGCGLGSSAAIIVAVIRALQSVFPEVGRSIDLNLLAYQSECLVHGTASGIDNTLAARERSLFLFKRGEPAVLNEIRAPMPIPMLIGLGKERSHTAPMVKLVSQSQIKRPRRFREIVFGIERLVLEANQAALKSDFAKLGCLINHNQKYLQELGVSTPQTDALVELFLKVGACGAKLTGSGGGGAVIGVFEDRATLERAASRIEAAGYQILKVNDIERCNQN